MRRIRIYDSNFTGKSASSPDMEPAHFEWKRKGKITTPTFFTDSHIKNIINYPTPVKSIAWMLEPYPLHSENYKLVEKMKGYFTHILTYDKEVISRISKASYYSFGGTWIPKKKWLVYPKCYGTSIIASTKNSLPGHKLRHEIVDNFGQFFYGIYGRGRNEIKDKISALKQFRYSVVVESCKFDYYFTEKLIDCFATGTIPIYWGCPSIGEFFDPNGIIEFDTLDELGFILKNLNHADYRGRLPSIYNNLIKAREYMIVEDWIYKNCAGLFQ